jgi:uncharacterized protein
MKVALRFVTADRTGLPIMQRVSMFRVTILMVVAVFPGVLFAQERPVPIIDMHLHANRADDNGPPPTYLCPGFENYGLDPKQPADALTKKPPCPNVLVGAATDETLMTEGAPSPETLGGWFRSKRFVAFGEVGIQYQGVSPSDPRFEPYLAVAESADVPLGIHMGPGPVGAPYLPGFGNYRARLHSPLELEEALLRHPKLRVYIMHAGWPMLDDLLAVLRAHPQVHVDVGIICYALPRDEFHLYLQRIVQAGFGSRIMFGSDQMNWPAAIELGIDAIESAMFLSPKQKRDILYDNAARFLRLTPEQMASHHGR